MSRLRVGVIANPYAAKRRSGNIGHDVCALLGAAGVSVIDLSAPDALTAKRRAEAVIDTLDALVVVGGDGTVALRASLVCDTTIRLGIVPAGSGNDFARAIGLPLDDADAAVRVIVSALARGEQRIDAIEAHFEGGPEGSSVIALGNLNMGFDAIVNARANRSRYGYSGAVARELLSYRPRRYLLEFVTVSGLSRAGLVRFFPRVFSGTHVSLPHYTVTACTSLTIGSDDPIEVCSDGETRAFLPLRARVLPGVVSILAPQLHDDQIQEAA